MKLEKAKEIIRKRGGNWRVIDACWCAGPEGNEQVTPYATDKVLKIRVDPDLRIAIATEKI